ncbi:(d)CMP kinase [Robertkochia solimangrovi]|uniref:(d)CMP kinase n=1 Tax=Robertkochia solimangrovi TaxID=2213046 RepID=UPI0011809C0B|nr:(d)CMP kinase [Robertkochia solimangrovi]TRZ43481.1 (d)CMP kinase [Robertkochia solimangrovi]
MKKKIIIAIDGFSSTGKSTIAKRLAKALGYVYVDTGAMYRAVTLYGIRKGFVSTTGEAADLISLIKALPEIALEFRVNQDTGNADIYLNDENVEHAIRTMEVADQVSRVAAIPEVRQKLVEQQKRMGQSKGIVMDGRDIGTVVFPEAELKLFMTASPETRAGRRYKELLERGDDVSYEEVLENVNSRDHLDSTRKDSPLVKADDAIEIDNSHLGLEDQFERILNYVKGIIEE